MCSSPQSIEYKMIENVTLFSYEYRGSSRKTIDAYLIHLKDGALRYSKNNTID